MQGSTRNLIFFCLWKTYFQLNCCHILDGISANTKFSLFLCVDSTSSMLQMLLLCPSVYFTGLQFLTTISSSNFPCWRAGTLLSLPAFCPRVCHLGTLSMHPPSWRWDCHSDSTPLVTGPINTKITVSLEVLVCFYSSVMCCPAIHLFCPHKPSVESLLECSPPSFGMTYL